jgi:hypothetical protein
VSSPLRASLLLPRDAPALLPGTHAQLFLRSLSQSMAVSKLHSVLVPRPNLCSSFPAARPVACSCPARASMPHAPFLLALSPSARLSSALPSGSLLCPVASSSWRSAPARPPPKLVLAPARGASSSLRSPGSPRAQAPPSPLCSSAARYAVLSPAPACHARSAPGAQPQRPAKLPTRAPGCLPRLLLDRAFCSSRALAFAVATAPSSSLLSVTRALGTVKHCVCMCSSPPGRNLILLSASLLAESSPMLTRLCSSLPCRVVIAYCRELDPVVLEPIGRILLSYLVHMHSNLRFLRQGQVHVGPITCEVLPHRVSSNSIKNTPLPAHLLLGVYFSRQW